MAPKICFVIAPIGDPETPVRERSDKLLKYFIGPAVAECGYEAKRADELAEPGIITTTVIQHIMEDPLVVADLTGWNPNVFYELALRHAVRKPFVQLIQKGERLPFDVAPVRTIQLDLTDICSISDAKSEMIKQIRLMEESGRPVENPVSLTTSLEMLRKSDSPEQKYLADAVAMLSVIESRLSDPARLIPPAYLKEVLGKDVRAVLEAFEAAGRRSEYVPLPVPPAAVLEILHAARDLSELIRNDENALDRGQAALQLSRIREAAVYVGRRLGIDSEVLTGTVPRVGG